jgi:hypothetical protein
MSGSRRKNGRRKDQKRFLMGIPKQKISRKTKNKLGGHCNVFPCMLGIWAWRRQAGDKEKWRPLFRVARAKKGLQRLTCMDGFFREFEEQQIMSIKCQS